MYRKLNKFGILLTLCFVTISIVGCNRFRPAAHDNATKHGAASVMVKVATVNRQSVSREVVLVGNLLPRRRSVIVAEVDGVIKSIPPPASNPTVVEYEGQKHVLPLDIGSEVTKGEVLIRLDDSDFQRSLNLANAKYDETKARLQDLMAWRRPEEVRRLESLRKEAKANRERAELEFKRAQPLVKQNAISRSEFDAATATLTKARALMAVAEANLEVAKAGPTKTQIAVAKASLLAAEAEVKQKQWKVERCKIVAPYNGVITDRWVDVGDRVTALPRVEIMEVMDVSFLVAQVGVPERYADKISVMDKADVQLEGSAKRITGFVVRVNDKIDGGSRTFRIRVAIKNEEREFRVGQFARVLITVDTAANALSIPQQSVTYTGGEPNVFVVNGDRVEKRSVKLGLVNDEIAEVLDGVKEGELVVVDDPAILTDGMTVETVQHRDVANVRGVPE